MNAGKTLVTADPGVAPPWLPSRPVRVSLLLLGVWVLSTFDLGFTLDQAGCWHFVELNPVAARVLHAPPYALVLYKLALLAPGTLILVCLRRHAVAELGCWLLLAAYSYVGVRWFTYYAAAMSLEADVFATAL